MILNSRGLLGTGLGKHSSRHASSIVVYTPPQIADIVWHYDFTDVSLLYQDDEASILVTAAEQEINAANPTAYATDTAKVEESAGLVGLYEEGGLNGLSYLDMGGSQTSGLHIASPTYDWTANTDRIQLTVCHATTACQGLCWDTTDTAITFGHRHTSSATDVATDYMGAGQCVQDHAAIGDYASLAWQLGVSNDAINRTNLSSNEVTQNTALAGAKTNLGINIGRYAGTTLPWTGRLYEVIMWEVTQATAVDYLAAIRQYVTDKYGLAWV